MLQNTDVLKPACYTDCASVYKRLLKRLYNTCKLQLSRKKKRLPCAEVLQLKSISYVEKTTCSVTPILTRYYEKAKLEIRYREYPFARVLD